MELTYEIYSALVIAILVYIVKVSTGHSIKKYFSILTVVNVAIPVITVMFRPYDFGQTGLILQNYVEILISEAIGSVVGFVMSTFIHGSYKFIKYLQEQFN